MTTLAFLRRRGPHSRLDLQYNGSIGTLEGTENVHNHRVTGKWDAFVTRRFYVTPLLMEYFRDRFQNIDMRVTPGAGVGYVLFDTRDFDWEVEGGGAYQYTRFDSVEPGEDREEQEGVARFATSVNIDITDDVEFRVDYTVTFGVPETQDAYHHALALFSVEIFNDLDLDVSFIWDRVETPRPDDDGERPDRDDFRLTVGLGYEF
jgi:putative salt-induced outer membrane protein YdiY